MQFTIYSSADASAPVLDGQAGSLVNVLDKILVAGYGSKLPAGWTKPYAGTNKAAYKMGSGNQRYLRVQDDGPGAHTSREARMTGYDSMTGVDTGTNPFPTAAQGVGGVAMVVLRKSAAADATVRSWKAFATSRHLYFFAQPGDTAGVYGNFFFGDFYSLLPNATGNTLIIGRTAEGSSSVVSQLTSGCLTSAVCLGHFMAHFLDGTGPPLTVGKQAGALTSALIPASALLSTSGSHGELYLDQIWITTTVGPTRIGRMPGMWSVPYAYNFTADGNTWSGAGALAGKTFYFLTPTANITATANTSAVILETSDTLEIN